MNLNKLFFLFCVLIIGCEKQFDKEFENTPEKNFEIFWKEFDRHYSYFEYKKINWDSLYTIYRPKINNNTNDNELLELLADMSYHLKDGHVTIFSPIGNRAYNHHEDRLSPTLNWIDISTIGKYCENLFSINKTIYYGRIIDKNIGYIYINNFGGEYDDYLQIDNILGNFMDTKGIIIDVRMNGGGTDTYGKIIASRFADEKRLFRKIRYRNGPEHNDFTNWIDDYIAPVDLTYLNPVIVLTNEYCFSSAEDFIQAMKVFPHVTTMGDTTGGGSGNPILRELPNGWTFRLSTWQAVDAEMNNIENKGIYPNISLWLTQEEFDNKIDKILETAIEKIDNE